MSMFSFLNLCPQFIKPRVLFIYIILFYEAHISNVLVRCHYQIAVQLVFQVHFQNLVVGLSLSIKKNVQFKFAWTQFVGLFDVC
jgi:hypothetical protein